jgi:two-component system, chemotaxis family, CheB/CheR fusion protein
MFTTQEDIKHFESIINVLVQKTGVALDHYKRTTLQRRILRRMNFLNIPAIEQYWEFIQQNEREQHQLYKDVLIHVSSFFRDEKSFDYLCSEIIPAIFKGKGKEDTVRVWICGCSTGEEAYSIAICMHEHAVATNSEAKIKIFASDLSENAISQARLAVYPLTALTKVSENRIQKYFVDHKGGKRIQVFIRDMCVFAVHNVLRHPPFAHLDLLSCRNVLIYMQPVLQKAVLATFSYALKEEGYLFLGKSEASNAGGRFEYINKSANVFISKERNLDLINKNSAQGKINTNMSKADRISNVEKKDFQKAADDLLLLKYIPAGVIVNDAYDIVDFRGYTGFYIEPSPGIASLNVLKMVRKGIYYELQEALNKVKAEKIVVKKEDIALEHEGKLLRVSLEIQPLSGTKEKYYLIVFQNVTPPDVPVNDDQINTTRDLRIFQLEQELMQSREQLRALSEEQEATSEEFQSTNEELKTLNEELQTSQEELVSTNEELTVRNRELNDLNAQLAAAKEYSSSINDTIPSSLIVLDNNLRVKTANISFYETFKANPEETENRLIYEIGNGQWNIPEFRHALEDVIPKKKRLVNFEVSQDFEKVGKRIMCLNAQELRAEKVDDARILLIIEDITERRILADKVAAAQEQLSINEERQRLAIESSQSGTWDYDVESNTLTISDITRKITGIDLEKLTSPLDLLLNIHPEDKDRVVTAIKRVIEGNDVVEFEEEYRVLKSANNNVHWINIKGRSLFDNDSKLKRFIGLLTDITGRKIISKNMEDALEQLKFALSAGEIGSWELNLADHRFSTSPQCKLNFGLPTDATFEYDDLRKMIIAEDRGKMESEVEHAILTRGVYSHEYRIVWPDDSIQWVLASGRAKYDDDGNPTVMSGISVNITARKNFEHQLLYSEQHFRALANSSPVMVAMSDINGDFYFFNNLWYQSTGKNLSSLKNRQWLNDIHPNDLDEFNQAFNTASQKHSKFSHNLRFRFKGRYRWISIIAVPRFSSSNKFDGYTVACTDIHDQKMATEELERKVDERTEALHDLNVELSDRNRELEQFAYVTSHDMQEPLRKIKMFTSRLLDKEATTNPEQLRYIRKIELSTIRMIGLIHDLLNYSHLQDKSHGFAPTDLNKTLQNVLVDFELLIQEKEAVISAGPLPVIDAVPAQMNQLFYNLLGNSLKFARKDVIPRINVTSTQLNRKEATALGLSDKQQYTCIVVEDNGIGFNNEYAEKIFEIFQRLHIKESYKGNGIGLALCKRIVQNHNGIINTSGEENKGARFEIILPVNS